MERKYEAPFKPKLMGPKDLKYIDKMFVHEEVEESLIDKEKM